MNLDAFLFARECILAYPPYTDSEDLYSVWRKALLATDAMASIDTKHFRDCCDYGEIEKWNIPKCMKIQPEDIDWLNDELKYFGIPIKVSVYADNLLYFEKF
ncbi:MAG: hypothetical protein F6K17_17785 [Okeania sp. SIO3C4]|nr:hypothetical protein [Okeania sp. SIO3B3]NER04327.1 hypothetical protein [Okeania sp. SIO3C4]